MEGKAISAVLFNRALIWIVLMHLTENKWIGALFALCAVLNMVDSFMAWGGAS